MPEFCVDWEKDWTHNNSGSAFGKVIISALNQGTFQVNTSKAKEFICCWEPFQPSTSLRGCFVRNRVCFMSPAPNYSLSLLPKNVFNLSQKEKKWSWPFSPRFKHFEVLAFHIFHFHRPLRFQLVIEMPRCDEKMYYHSSFIFPKDIFCCCCCYHINYDFD